LPRRGPAPVRELPPDPVYNSVTVTQLINKVMRNGKKALAERIVYGALRIAEERTKESGLDILMRALENTKPQVEVRSRRVGGATYQVPIEVRPRRANSLGLRWIVQAARARRDKTMTERLAAELLDAANGTGGAVKRREEVHRMAEANKAFAHYRW
jgi:small subunit ribosomal protein S7